ncbi:unnamed protein product [Coregonus sp. 'balchen']|nr:unnamed protein product [Coregonus sp. 'balchen']
MKDKLSFRSFQALNESTQDSYPPFTESGDVSLNHFSFWWTFKPCVQLLGDGHLLELLGMSTKVNEHLTEERGGTPEKRPLSLTTEPGIPGSATTVDPIPEGPCFLQGQLCSVPWTVFEDTSLLKILHLKHNCLDVLPEHVLKFLPGLTYLDLFLNHLTFISRDVFLNWPLYQRIQSSGQKDGVAVGFTPNVVLELHDNPWLCDYCLKGFIEFIKALSPPIIRINSYLTCSRPEFRAGKFFHEVELKIFMKPMAPPQSRPLGFHVIEKEQLEKDWYQ